MIINLRGSVIPVIDLRKRFGLSGQTVGLIVDAVHEVVKITGDCIEPPPPSFVMDARFVQGIGKLEDRLVILLDIDRIVTTQESVMIKEMAG